MLLMKASRIASTLKKHWPELQQSHRIRAIYLFGSVARGEARKNSDIDILVEFSSSDIGIFEFVRLQNHLTQLLGRPVDLVTRDALRDEMREAIERDSVRVA
jgi:predicted nucleotidyltransferase